MSRRITLIITVILLAVLLALWQWNRSQSIDAALGENTQTPARNLAGNTGPHARASSAASSPTRNLQASSQDSIEGILNSRYGGSWNATRDEWGRVTSISGGMIHGKGASFEKARDLAGEIARELGYPSEQLLGRPVKEDSTELSKSYRFLQTYEGFEVYGGSMAILARKEDGAVYLVNSELKTVESIHSQPRLSPESARDIVAGKYSSPGTSIKLVRTDPVIWAEQPRHELAWIFAVEVSTPSHNTYQVIVGAETGGILQDKSTLKH